MSQQGMCELSRFYLLEHQFFCFRFIVITDRNIVVSVINFYIKFMKIFTLFFIHNLNVTMSCG